MKCFNSKKMAYILSILGWVIAIPSIIACLCIADTIPTLALKFGIIAAVSSVISCATATPAIHGRKEVLEYYGVYSIKELIFNRINGYKFFQSLTYYALIISISATVVTGLTFIACIIIICLEVNFITSSLAWNIFAPISGIAFCLSMLIMLGVHLLRTYES